MRKVSTEFVSEGLLNRVKRQIMNTPKMAHDQGFRMGSTHKSKEEYLAKAKHEMQFLNPHDPIKEPTHHRSWREGYAKAYSKYW